jgi:hypothetical protein
MSHSNSFNRKRKNESHAKSRALNNLPAKVESRNAASAPSFLPIPKKRQPQRSGHR